MQIKNDMKIENCTIEDYHQIISNIAQFWGSDRTLSVHHPMYVYEFVNSAFVIKQEADVIAYLFGFISQTAPVGYVHLLGVRTDLQKKGLGKLLYTHFIDFAKEKHCKKIKAITSPTNSDSIAFHRKIGMKLLGTKNENGIEVVQNYSGPGQDRVVFDMEI